MSHFRKVLEALQAGSIDIDGAMDRLRTGFFEDLGHSRVDHHRAERIGAPEVVFGEGKSAAQICGIVQSLVAREQNVLITRIDAAKAREVAERFPAVVYHELARVMTLQVHPVERVASYICIACAGTSDLAVAEEARLTAEFYGNPVRTVYDAGVAGLHRLLAEVETLRGARVVVAVAGMEGALPSVVAGLVKAPVIAVPTSVGYGASFGGVAALLAMLNSCASGLSVVNIDNGFGAGFLASLINRL